MGTWRPVTLTPADRWGPLPPHAAGARRRGTLRWLERLLFLVAIVSLGYYAYVSAETALYQAYENRELDTILTSGPAAPPADPSGNSPATRIPPPAGTAIGRIEIPRLGVSAVVRVGSDARTLRLAVGHIPGTALPGDAGNVGLAGHRDTFFRRLRDIETGDEIRVVTAEGIHTYRVESTHVVEPSDVWVLDPTEHPSLTLVTCYPFHFVGSAPQRFIVRAALELPA